MSGMLRFKIDIRTTGFHVFVPFDNDRYLIQNFTKRYTSYEERFIPGRGKQRVPKKVYATYNSVHKCYGLHINLFEEFITFLKENHVHDSSIEVYKHESHIGEEADIILKSDVVLREQQIPVVKYMTDNKKCTVIPAPTGFGKTISTLYSIATLKTRAMVVMGAMHIETWVTASEKFYTSTKKVKVIRGSIQLKRYIQDGLKNRLTVDLFLVSINTIRDYLSEYEELGYSTYGCTPIELYKVLGIGLKVTDEVHENLHFNFRHDIETDCPKAIYLSATIDSYNSFTNKLYKVIYPIENRYSGFTITPYVNVMAIGYCLKDSRYVRYKGFSNMYSHIVYEEWIMKSPERLNNYLSLIKNILYDGFIKDYRKGLKALIIFSKVEMCQIASKYFANAYPHLTHTSYNGEDEDEVLHSFDVVCSTLGSAGTGKDIKGLKTVILTIGLQGKEKNQQVMGRLRNIENDYPGINHLYYYLVCKDIPPHMNYHFNKLKLFNGKVKSHRTVNALTII